jgi:hypothetical protein
VRGCFPRQTTVSRRMPTHDAPKVELIPHTLPITEAYRRNKPVRCRQQLASSPIGYPYVSTVQ